MSQPGIKITPRGNTGAETDHDPRLLLKLPTCMDIDERREMRGLEGDGGVGDGMRARHNDSVSARYSNTKRDRHGRYRDDHRTHIA